MKVLSSASLQRHIEVLFMVIRTSAVLLALLILCPSSGGQVKGTGSVTLPDGSRFKTTLYDMKVVGRLKTEHKLPCYILSGFGCYGCDANRSIYIHSPSDGAMKNEGEQPRFSYPGKETDYRDGSLVYEAKMFFGDCLTKHPNAVVWFERSLGDDKKWHEDVLVAEVNKDRLVTNLLRGDLSKASEAESAARSGRCHEVPGIKRSSEP
jgi:hypothetical protein